MRRRHDRHALRSMHFTTRRSNYNDGGMFGPTKEPTAEERAAESVKRFRWQARNWFEWHPVAA